MGSQKLCSAFSLDQLAQGEGSNCHCPVGGNRRNGLVLCLALAPGPLATPHQATGKAGRIFVEGGFTKEHQLDLPHGSQLDASLKSICRMENHPPFAVPLWWNRTPIGT